MIACHLLLLFIVRETGCELFLKHLICPLKQCIKTRNLLQATFNGRFELWEAVKTIYYIWVLSF